MLQQLDEIIYKLRYTVIGGLVLCILLLLSTLFGTLSHAAGNTDAQDSSPSSIDLMLPDDSNAVTSAFVASAHGLAQISNGTGEAIHHSFSGINDPATAIAKLNAHSFLSFNNTMQHSASSTANVCIAGISFIGRMPAAIFGGIARTPIVSAVITPGSLESSPTINPDAPITLTTATTPAATLAVSIPVKKAQVDQMPQWPIHGAITTYFGASDWPYQLHHTGIDISDGAGSGVTAVHPFKPGTVVQVIRSGYGLGNHVVIDHGGGITSVYGHMYSVAVSEGQVVDKNTILGTEGTTGASTGPHVHFEIRLNGSPVNPQNYIQGTP